MNRSEKGKKKDDEQKKKIDAAKRMMKGSIDLIITTIDGYLDEFIASLPAKK